ncbi:MAG: RlmE family RNA methyltransferase [Treponema sp.]|nr:RlmE family RNA methyltransferase [Treponema sp.]
MTDYKKPDHWQQKARKEGYPARSVYKLIEIDEKFNIFKNNRKSSASFRVLDIGAAPGSWSLYVMRNFSDSKTGRTNSRINLLAAADLSPLSREFDNGLFDGGNFFFIQGDVTADDVRDILLSKGPYSVIISDAAPNTTGSHLIDSARSLELAETVVFYAEKCLTPGGNLALKIFQGGGTDALLKKMKTFFETAKSFKPQACRGESVETYYIGLNKKI